MPNVRIRLETLLSWITLISAIAYTLGWLQTLYYFESFGIGLKSLDLSVQDYLFESWFVMENVLFFILLFWLVVKSGRWWAIAAGIFYFFIPIAAHYAFLFSGHWWAEFLIAYRHTLLKFLPFVLYALAWLFDRRTVGRLKDLSWPFSQSSLVLFLLIVLAWAISTAKHFGSFDANLAQRDPQRYFSSVKVHLVNNVSGQLQLDAGKELYLIYATPARYFIWDHTGYAYGRPGDPIHVIEIPKDKVESIESWKSHSIQRGGLYL